MKIETFVNQVAEENTYLLTFANGHQLLIDPGSDEKYLANLSQPQAVLLTHAHFDHIWGLKSIKEAFPNIQIWLAESERNWLSDPVLNCSRLMLGFDLTTVEATNFYDFSKTLEFADCEITVRPTPGHSIGSVTLVFEQEKSIFSGDALFKNSIGRTDLPTGNFDQLIHSIKKEILTIPNDFQVFPGHGPMTTIAEEKQFNPFLS